MATAPAEREPEPTPVQRVRAVIAKPVGEKQRPVTLLAISAGLVALAPLPFGPLGAVLLVIVAAEQGRKR